MILITKNSDQTQRMRHIISLLEQFLLEPWVPCAPPLRCVCVFIKLHITVQSGPVIYSFYATARSVCVCVCVCVCV